MADTRRSRINPRLFANGVLGGLAAAVLVVVAMVVLGEYTKTRGRLLLTALTLAGFSLTALGPSALLRVSFRPVAAAGMSTSLLAFVLVTVGLWATPDPDAYWKATAVASLLAVSLAHLSWMLLLERRGPLATGMSLTSVAAASLVAILAGTGIILEVRAAPFWWVFSLFVIAQVATGVAALLAPLVSRRQSEHVDASSD